jgi:dynein heavy chain, axonemal
LKRAEKLLGGLSSESERWKVSSEKLEEDLKNLTGNIMLSAGFVAYLGPFTAGYRQNLISKWIGMFLEKSIPTSNDYELERILSDEN